MPYKVIDKDGRYEANGGDKRIVELVRSIMGNGTMVVETPNESELMKLFEFRGTPIPLDPQSASRNVDADWDRLLKERAANHG